jgi:two-component system heavy metal sensor histidine kinase CusS
MDDVDEKATIDYVQRGWFVALLLGTLFSAGLGSVVARRGMAFAGDRRNRRAHHRKSTQRTHRSVRQPAELATLAMALNLMLGRLEASFVRMSQFAEDVAHELRTPIHNMMGEAKSPCRPSASPRNTAGFWSPAWKSSNGCRA